MRSPAEALKDPRPGDVFGIGSSKLTVKEAGNNFRYNFDGWLCDAPIPHDPSDWREWWADLTSELEVLHVS